MQCNPRVLESHLMRSAISLDTGFCNNVDIDIDIELRAWLKITCRLVTRVLT